MKEGDSVKQAQKERVLNDLALIEAVYSPFFDELKKLHRKIYDKEEATKKQKEACDAITHVYWEQWTPTSREMNEEEKNAKELSEQLKYHNKKYRHKLYKYLSNSHLTA